MAILNFQKPDKVIMISSTEFEGKFEFRPLEPGYGLTVGNALRRVLLSSLEGFAITSVRIEGVEHEFSAIEGVVEDVTEIILNLKQVRFKHQLEEVENETFLVSITDKEQITAGDLQKFVSGFQILNPDLVICNLSKSVNFNMELTIEKGRGYLPAEENKKSNAVPVGTIFIDSIYTPIKNVKYSVENYRVEQKTDYEKLIFEISSENETFLVSITDKEQITAGDLQKFVSGFQILNPDLVICNLSKSVNFNMELTIEKGRGYLPAEENKKSNAVPVGTIFIDSIYTPIKNVKYSVENYRVEQKTDYEKLIFEISSDGSIHPKDALTEAAKILIHHFMLFSDERITLEADEIAQTETYDEESLHMRQLLKTKLIDMDLSVRALNCLKAAEVDTLGDLVSFNKNDLMKFRNFGKKSLTELEELVNVKGLSFGMDLTKYKLDID